MIMPPDFLRQRRMPFYIVRLHGPMITAGWDIDGLTSAIQ